MFIVTYVRSKLALIIMLSVFSVHVPMQAFIESEQLVEETINVINDHSEVALIVALAVVLSVYAYADYKQVLRKNEEKIYRQKQCNPQEQYLAQRAVEEAVEQARIDDARERYAQEKLIFQQKYAAQTAEKLEEIRLLEEKKKAELLAELERLSEEFRNLEESQNAEEERINALGVEEFSRYMSLRISEIESLVDEIKKSEVMQSVLEVQELTTLLPEDVIDFYMVRKETLNKSYETICEKLVLVETLEAYFVRRMEGTLEVNSTLELLQEKINVLKEQVRELKDLIRCALNSAHTHRPRGEDTISGETLLRGLLLLGSLLK